MSKKVLLCEPPQQAGDILSLQFFVRESGAQNIANGVITVPKPAFVDNSDVLGPAFASCASRLALSSHIECVIWMRIRGVFTIFGIFERARES